MYDIEVSKSKWRNPDKVIHTGCITRILFYFWWYSICPLNATKQFKVWSLEHNEIHLYNCQSISTEWFLNYWWLLIIGFNNGLAHFRQWAFHYNDVIMSTIASQITSLMIVYSDIYSGADQRKHQSSTSLAFVQGIHQGPVNSLHKWPVTWKNVSISWRRHVYLHPVIHQYQWHKPGNQHIIGPLWGKSISHQWFPS